MSSRLEAGSALIEALVIGSVSFLVIAATVSASIRIAVSGAELQEAARAGAVHAARHGDVESARAMTASLYPGVDVDVRRIDDRIVTSAALLLELPGADRPRQVTIVGRAEMPLAPFRSDRG